MHSLNRNQHASTLYQPIAPAIQAHVKKIAEMGGRDSLDELVDKVTCATKGEPRKRRVIFYIPTPAFTLDE